MSLCVTLLRATSLKIDRLIAQPCDVWHRYQESWKEVNRRWILQVTSPTSAISAASASRQSKFCHRLSKNRHPAVQRAVDFAASQFQFCTTCCIWWGRLHWFPSGRDCGPTFTKFDGKVILSEAKWFLLVLIKNLPPPEQWVAVSPLYRQNLHWVIYPIEVYENHREPWRSKRIFSVWVTRLPGDQGRLNKVETSDQVEV